MLEPKRTVKRRAAFIAIAVCAAAGFLAAADVVRRTAIDAWNRQQLQDLAARTLVRAEVAIDLAVINMGDLLSAGHTDCTQDTIAAIRRTAFSVGSLEDIHVVRPGHRCRAFPDFKEGARESARARQAARNQSIALLPMAAGGWAGLGVAWSFGDGLELLAVMSTDSLVFDMLPGELREDASVILVLDDGTPVARYRPQHWGEDVRSDAAFESVSSRYPIAARIDVGEATLAAWRRTAPPNVVAMVVTLAIAFGVVTARGLSRRSDPAEELDAAVAAGEILPQFQPIVSLADQRIVGCEMLARWIRPNGSSVAPERFISLAEMWGRADHLTDALLVQSAGTLAAVIAARPSFKFCFNVTPGQFVAVGFVERVLTLADDHGLPRDQLIVELTEREQIPSVDAAERATAELAAAGVRVAIDDTGTGHNGLAMIKGLGAACLKIDKLFIDGVDGDPRARALVEMLVQVAREFGMHVVAEGIERPEQVAVLLSLGVREGQGFLFSPPLPADEFIALVEAGDRQRNEPAHARSAARAARAA